MGRHLDSSLRFSGTSDVVTIGAASAQSAAFGAHTHEIRVVAAAATEGCWIKIGDNPTASAADGSMFLPVGQVEYFHVSPGQQIAVIQVSTGGSLSVAEMTR